jgi:hypothetical protein
MNPEIKDLQIEIESIEDRIIKTQKSLHLAIDMKNKFLDRLHNLRQKYSSLDLQLAMLDGRYKLLAPQKTAPLPSPISPSLSPHEELKKLFSQMTKTEKNTFLIDLLE